MIKRLGEMGGFAFNAISPMNEIAPDTEVLIGGLPADAMEKTDGILNELGMMEGASDGRKPTKAMNAFIQALFEPEACLRAEGKERVYVHSFAKNEENMRHIAGMLTGDIGFELPEGEKGQTEKPSAKRVLRGIGIALLVNICAAVLVAVLKAVL